MDVHIRLFKRPGELVAAIIGLVVVIELALTIGWQGMIGQPVLRVAAPATQWVEGGLSPYGPGFEQELLDRFCADNGMSWVWMKARSWDDAWEMLRDGRADVVLGLGSNPPDSLAVPIAAGPAYARFEPLLIKAQDAPDPAKTCGSVFVAAGPALDAVALNMPPREGCAPTPVAANQSSLRPILEALDSEDSDGPSAALVDSGRFQLLQPFYHTVKADRRLPGDIEYRWFWSERSPELARALDDFWGRTIESDTFASMRERYFGFLPEETDYYELYHLLKTLRNKLPRYEEQILSAARENGIDPLLLVALIYQESRFNPRAESKTGVRGLMQLTQATAADLGVNRNDPFQSIDGGARYLKELYRSFEDTGLSPYQRWFFTLAAYNRGRGHVEDAMELARSLGGTGTSWLELKESFPKLSYEKYYRNARYGYTRGREVVHYVDNVRYYYYVLHGLVVLSRPEAQQLAAFTAMSPL
ncbi:membrane-bound lytic murein transglycosylase F [Desulfobaculum xiamenense]|uniref:Membrane-bound lytic murein transglycosylase F n=1 Tax=Desulfobaculum xiamenense TaxID=995050 RepID=A0A846QUH1_9BACT|nr:transglycosylase SLT domain-containing protein [Desulfobaculum xiamenense]NJB69165.1 membrane-bound lytic murein transglycosylase F [Desulfobaculum xiamenense]